MGPPSPYFYVNAGRTHEVVAIAEPAGDDVDWSVLERPSASRDPADALVAEARFPVSALAGHVRDLEARLAASGEYYRVDPVRNALAPLAAPPPVDMRAHAVQIPGAAEGAHLEYMHFHRSAGTSRVLLAMPRDPANGRFDRFVLARYEFPHDVPSAGKLSIVHPRLAPEMIVGQVASDHLTLPRSGYRKLFEPREYREALGERWTDVAQNALAHAARAFRLPFTPRPPPPAPEARAPTAPRDAVADALLSEAYLAARAEFLARPESVLGGGPHAVHQFVRRARQRAGHSDQVKISLLEAGLLVEVGILGGNARLVEEHGAQLVRLSRTLAPSVG